MSVEKSCKTCKFFNLDMDCADKIGLCNSHNNYKGWQSQEANSGLAINQEHYMQAEVEPIEIMQMYLSHEQFIGFLHGNVIKYSLRYQYKGQAKKDLEKAAQYLSWMRKAMDGEKINPKEGI